MTADDGAPVPSAVYHQEIRVESGVGYGVIGADMHVFGDGVPIYLLESWRSAREPDPAWLRELPSRLLNARFEVVSFTGRSGELSQLREWRQAGPRFAVRWLHGPAGAGKTRLAAKFASDSVAENWKVVIATHGPGTLLPVLDSQDLRPGNAEGLLLIVDYADRWPATHLAMLLSNRLLRQPDVRTRILMLARTADDWPGIRAKLISEQPATSSQRLEPMAEDSAERSEMFTAAIEGFARHFELADLSGLRPPASLEHPDFGLTLAVHMAALVTLDARQSGRRAPQDLSGLTIYLLDREHDHWALLYGDGTHELSPAERTFLTPPGILRRAVFTAALTGPVDRATAVAILEGVPDAVADPFQVLDDHAVCYPPTSPDGADVLEPLYPDRLAEDFIALTIPGHMADYPDQRWATIDAGALLARLIDEDLARLSIPNARLPAARRRAVIFLASAAQRWPHVARNCLFPTLSMFPRLAVAAGGPALTALAAIGDTGPRLDEDLVRTLNKIFEALPDGPDLDLDIGAAQLTERLAAHYLDTAADPVTRARWFSSLAVRCRFAGRYSEALAAAEQAVAIRRGLAKADPAHLDDLVSSLTSFGGALSDAGRLREALAAAEEAVEISRRLAAADPGEHLAELAVALNNLGVQLSGLGRTAESIVTAQEAVEIQRRLADADPALAGHHAQALANLAAKLSKLGRNEEAVAAAREAVATNRRLSDAYPGGHLPGLALSLGNLGIALAQEDERAPDGLACAEECVALFRRLVQANPNAYRPGLAMALNNLGSGLDDVGRTADALVARREAVAINRRLSEDGGSAHLPELASSLINLGHNLADAGYLDEAVVVSTESAAIYRSLAADFPAAHLPDLAAALNFLGNRLTRAGRLAEALPPAEEAVQIFRRVADADPSALLPDLVVSLSNLCGTVSMGGDPARSLPLAEEAVAISRRLAPPETTTGLTAHAYALNNLTATLLRLGHARDAVLTARESVAVFKRLADLGPNGDNHGLNVARTNLALALKASRHGATARNWLSWRPWKRT